MTCIVGVEHRGRVVIGGDSAGVAGHSLQVRADAKVFRNGPYVMGFTTSFRMGQLLRYAFKAPEPPADPGELYGFMVTRFVDDVRKCLKDGGFLTKSSEVESGGTFLVGVRGSLFLVGSDFQIGQTAYGYDAVGCGQDLALGALHATRDRGARYRVETALSAAAAHSAGVSGPYALEAT